MVLLLHLVASPPLMLLLEIVVNDDDVDDRVHPKQTHVQQRHYYTLRINSTTLKRFLFSMYARMIL